MIRPITVICWVLALSAGLYLYRAKHEVELMDKHIEQIAKETTDIRAESRRLLDDWIRLGEPEQLHKYSDEYLGLKTIAPTQFARLSDLPSRLPAPRADPPPEQTDMAVKSDTMPAAAAPGAGQTPAPATDNAEEADGDDLPLPPIPPAAPLLVPVAQQVMAPVPLQARPVTARAAQPEQKPRLADDTRAAPKPEPFATNGAVANGSVNGLVNAANGLPPLQAQTPPDAPRRVMGSPVREAEVPDPRYPPRPSSGQATGLPAMGSPQMGSPQMGSPQMGSPLGNQAQPVGRQVPWPSSNDAADPRTASPRPQPPQAAPRTPVQYGSLLGTPRGPAPLPVPAPTPVNASWPRPYPPQYPAPYPPQYSAPQYPAPQYAAPQYPGSPPAPYPYPAAPAR